MIPNNCLDKGDVKQSHNLIKKHVINAIVCIKKVKWWKSPQSKAEEDPNRNCGKLDGKCCRG